MPPARFVRELLRRPVHFEVLAHHPYSVGGPFRHALNADDVSLPDLGKLLRPLRAAERAGRALPARAPSACGSRGLLGQPPADPDGVPALVHARWLAEALYVLWRQGADAVLWFQVRDQAPRPSYAATSQSGILRRDGRPKPARRAFSFPFVARRGRDGRVGVWTLAPAAGTLAVERRVQGGWQLLSSGPVARSRVVRPSPRRSARRAPAARVGDMVSLTAIA
jgi:hypothetical protein